MQQQRLRTGALISADVVALVLLRPPARLAADLGHPRAWVARVGLDSALASLAATALWVVAAWVGLGLLAVAARHAPGGAGRIAGRISDAVLPSVLRRIIAGSAGVGVLLAPLPATASPEPAHRHAAAAGSAVSGDHPTLRAPRWPSAKASVEPSATPTAPGAPTPAPGQASRRVPPPRWPSAAPGRTASADDETPSGPRSAHPPTPVARRHVPAGHAGSTRVRPGDCLWLIAARRLGPDATDAEIAGSWPRWYAANQNVIGDDPDVIRPGVVLQAPTAHHSEAGS
jgi:hypothetical protein